MGFAAGFQAGSAAVERGMAMGERFKQRKREDEEYARQKQAREEYHKLQQDYYTGQGDFAATGAPPAMPDETQAEQRRLGIQAPAAPTMGTMADSAGIQQPAGLSLADRGGVAPKPMDQTAKDQLYFKKLAQWGQTHLEPEKAAGFMRDVTQLQETNYQQQRVDAFRKASSGDRSGLDTIAKMYNGLVPDGYDMDTSQATFDPEKGWTGVRAVNSKTGEAKEVALDDKAMAGLFMRSDPAQLLEMRLKLAAEARAGKADKRADSAEVRATNADTRDQKRLDLAVGADARDSKMTDARIRQIDASIANDKALMGYRWSSLDIDKQRLSLEKSVKAGDEKAKDLLVRQNMFASTYGLAGKLDPNSPTYEQDQARAAAGKQLAGLATSIYGLSAEGAKPEARNAIAAETDLFIRQFDAGTLDKSKLKDNGDGTTTYGRLRVPTALFDEGQPAAAAPEKKPGVKTNGKAPSKGKGLSANGEYALRAPVTQLSTRELHEISPGHPSYEPAQQEIKRRSDARRTETAGIRGVDNGL